MTKIYLGAEYDSIDIETLPAVTLRDTKRRGHIVDIQAIGASTMLTLAFADQLWTESHWSTEAEEPEVRHACNQWQALPKPWHYSARHPQQQKEPHEHTAIDNLRAIAQRWQIFAPSTTQHDDALLNAAADLLDLIGRLKGGGSQEKLNGWIELWRWLDAKPQ